MDSNLFKTKTIEQLVRDVDQGGKSLRRSLTAWDLTLLGIGAIIGTGIFVLTGTAAANQAGPAITMSYLAAGLACAFAALCYAEFASMIPIAGSAYTYAYATLGELVAWMNGWDLILEYAVGSMTVAIGWSGYMQRLLQGVGIPGAEGLQQGGVGGAAAGAGVQVQEEELDLQRPGRRGGGRYGHGGSLRSGSPSRTKPTRDGCSRTPICWSRSASTKCRRAMSWYSRSFRSSA